MDKPLAHILYIDDEEDIRAIAGMCLETVGGLRVTLCDSAASGLNALRAEKPDMILLDVMMPVTDGPTTLTLIRENPQYDSVPVVFITARAQAEDIKKYLALGAIGVIEKPFDPMNLSSQVLALWEKA